MEIFSIIRNEKNEKKIIHYIEENNVNIDVTDEDNYNMLMMAISQELFELSKYLISNNINLNHQNYKGMSALHILAFYYNEEVLLAILNRDIDLSLVDDYGNNALWTTIMNDKGFGTRLKMIELLLKKGIDKNQLNNVDKSPLFIARTLNYPKIVELLEAG
ncbi:ankyrin repeat domain-containing protein [Flavivirga aquimarina]|uniref:Ankyrin repeat domain-containing protein n=1 Tax=Flavivirga aquimarina TaxID=2027862 RepID=A0ABT8WG75_9FLAO|nr:ankyrin repeat domain-containing protein [Flavivirga aquimarina]MDO5971996.1 ankyrin repeat domain-containing protein [Flavivirga aquimarina]